MKGFDPDYADLPDYIIKVTREIWEDRGIATLNRTYAHDIVVRTPMGLTRGNRAVIASTMATCHEFPDRQLFADDVIWSGNAEDGFLSSHRLVTTGTHRRDGQFGPATNRSFRIHVIADCAVRGGVIDDEWLVRDQGGIVRQLGMDPRSFAQGLIDAEGGPAAARRVFTPDRDVAGPYAATGNDNEWGGRYAESLDRIMDADFRHILQDYDRGVQGFYPGATTVYGRPAACAFWVGLRASFPNAAFAVHHRIGMDGGMMSPRASVRWSLDGLHDGWGAFGPPTGAHVHVFGMSHAEFGPWGLRREWALFDEVAVWKQILMAAS